MRFPVDTAGRLPKHPMAAILASLVQSSSFRCQDAMARPALARHPTSLSSSMTLYSSRSALQAQDKEQGGAAIARVATRKQHLGWRGPSMSPLTPIPFRTVGSGAATHIPHPLFVINSMHNAPRSQRRPGNGSSPSPVRRMPLATSCDHFDQHLTPPQSLFKWS